MKIIFQPLKSSSACYVWNKLAKAAYEIHDADYFYQLDSDSIFMSRCTISQLVHTLAAKDFVPNFGIAAAFAPQHPSIITNALFSRLHMRIFHGQFLPSPPPQVGVLIKNITYPICMAKRTHFCAIQSL